MRLHPMLILLLILSSCSDKKSNFKVEGIVDGLTDTTVYLYQRSLSGTLPVDSVTISHKGEFDLRGYTDEPNFYILFVHKDRYINLIIHPGDRIRVLTAAETFDREYFIEGSKDSRLIHKLIISQATTLDRITELSNEYENSRSGMPQIRNRIDSLYTIVFNEHKKYSIDFIRENKSSLVALMALYQQLGRQSPVFDYKKDFRYFEEVDSALCIRYPASEAVKDLNKKVTQIREMLKVDIGSIAPPLVLPDINGQSVVLSSLKGRPVLVNFWASWSDASIAQNKILSGIYQKYHAKGFEVLQVSLDRNRESWIRAVQNNNSGWIHVSDLAYWDSPVVTLYRIDNLPANYLIDPKGIIIAKNIKDQELEQKLTELLY